MKNAETTKDKLLKSIEDDGFFAAAVSSKTQLFQNQKVVHFSQNYHTKIVLLLQNEGGKMQCLICVKTLWKRTLNLT